MTDPRATAPSSRTSRDRGTAPPAPRVPIGTLLALAFISGGALIAEVTLTRFFSFILSYHYVFVVVSIAVLGMGMGGVLAHGFRRRFSGDILAPAALAYATTMGALPVALAAVVRVDAVALYALLSFVPFLFAGTIISAAFGEFAGRATILYLADLAGAATGAGISVWILSRLGPVNTMFLVAAGGAVAGVLLSRTRGLRRAGALGLLVAVGVLGSNMLRTLVDVRPEAVASSKALFQVLRAPSSRLAFTRWSAFARTDVVETERDATEKFVLIDGGASSSMRRFGGDLRTVHDLEADLGFLPYAFRRVDTALVIGPGGGKDLLLGLLGNARHMTAVEVDPGTVAAMRHFAPFNGALYDHPAVSLALDEGRSFLKRTQGRYDLIFLALVRTGASERAGLALAENYLFTLEAFSEYLSHLTEDGLVSLRVYSTPELVRAFTTAVAALARQGYTAAQATRHLVAVTDPGLREGPEAAYPLLLIKRSPFTADQARRVADIVGARGFSLLFAPHVKEEGAIAALSEGMPLEAFVARERQVDLSPPRDDRPFFYELHPGLPGQIRTMGWGLAGLVAAGVVLLSRLSREHGSDVWHFGGYYAALGAGFMLLEVAMIQRLILLLGHPTIAVATILGALLLFAGMGSLLSGLLQEGRLARFAALITVLIGGMSLAYAVAMPALVTAFILHTLGVRVIATLAVLLPLGLLLGMPFPTGMRLLQHRRLASLVTAMWTTNGVASVIGAVTAVALAMTWGFTWSIVGGSLCYLLAGLLISASSTAPRG
ncbi:MAG: hypothetical protein HY660_08625 [Armatimonadetes bacterium]|nr:hypothetical protein [Armatimonadota bacterium]